MHYVIIRDDDTNAFTPVECLERLYRPFLERGLPVNLATIPAVSPSATMADGRPEGFLVMRQPRAEGEAAKPASGFGTCPAAGNNCVAAATSPEQPPDGSGIPIGANPALVEYLRANPGFHIVQHGCHHNYLEFDCADGKEVSHRLDEGARLLREAGFAKPLTFVAPYDKLSRTGLRAVAARFRVLSTGWYELRRLPYSWWPSYGIKKLRHSPHWRIGRTLLLSHPGCLLSCNRTLSTMLGGIFHYVQTQQLTVLVTHWWEYFRNGEPDGPFIDFLHETAAFLSSHQHLRVITFDDLIAQNIRLN